MEDRRQRNGRMSVPQFGSWENQGGGGGGSNPADGYTMIFTKARVDRKEQKAKPVPPPIFIPVENNTPSKPRPRRHHHDYHNHHRHGGDQRHNHQLGDEGKKNILAYLNCCIRP